MDRYTLGTVVTANARLSRQLRRNYDAERRERGLRVWESPDILPRGAWLARVWQECAYRDPFRTPVLLSTVQEEALWERAITAAADTLDPTGSNNVLLDLSATVAAAAEAWRLMHAWEAQIDAAEFYGLSDTEAFLGWMQAVERRLRDEGWITASELPRALFDRLTAGRFAPGAFFHAGFNELAPADRRLFEACGAQPSPAALPFLSLCRYRLGLQDSSEEFIQAAGWARRILEENPRARIGIVVRGLAGMSTAAERIFDDIFHPGLEFARCAGESAAFHISAGVPSADVPLIAQALLALGIKPGLRIGEAGMLLRSPFIRIDKRQSAQLFAALRRAGLQNICFEVDAIRRAFPVLAKAAEELPEQQHPSEWCAAFSKLLQRAGWPGDRPLNAAEHQAVEHWKDLLSELAGLDAVIPQLTYAQALQRLQRMAHDKRFAPRDEDAPVQVMDMLEAAGSQFDALWIAGLHGGVWPATPRPNPFLPLSLQRTAGMPHSSAERELGYARRVTNRLLASAPEVICSYPLFSGEEKLRVSPLLEELPEITSGGGGDSPSQRALRGCREAPPDTALRRIFASAAPLEVLALGQAPPLPPGTLQSGGMRVLADQAACPFRAFAVYRLGAREFDAPDIGISPSERGSVAHQALENFWREIGSQRELKARSADQIAMVIERSVRAALDGRLSRRQKDASLERSCGLEQVRLQRLLTEWLALEHTRPDFEVVECETKSRIEAGGLKLDVRADRVDRLSSGAHVVLDYKTSDKLNVQDWEGDRPDAPQLPLYAVKSERQVDGVYYAKLVPGKTALLGCSGDEFRRRKPDWIRVVDQLGASFLQGDAAIDPKNAGKTCELCQLHSLCRIAERDAAAIPGDAGVE